MSVAYVDTSYLAAILLEEPGAREDRLNRFASVWSSNLLAAELLSVIRREGLEVDREELFHHLRWIFPDRPLNPELALVFAKGNLRGADAWHLACALLLSPKAEITFLSLDARQRAVARSLGFAVEPPA
ncbi:MAG: PIN domain-containing protein [Thermoanaerobaculia bacterium]